MNGRRLSLGDAGYSLLELLVVLAILALATVVAAPHLTQSRGPAVTTIAERVVRDSMRQLRAEAIRSNAETWLRIDADGRTLTTSSGRRIALPGQASIAPAPPLPAVGLIRFFPSGRSSGIRWRLSVAGRSKVIAVDWLTGYMRDAPS
jgi:general secretion pathway protein H